MKRVLWVLIDLAAFSFSSACEVPLDLFGQSCRNVHLSAKRSLDCWTIHRKETSPFARVVFDNLTPCMHTMLSIELMRMMSELSWIDREKHVMGYQDLLKPESSFRSPSVEIRMRREGWAGILRIAKLGGELD